MACFVIAHALGYDLPVRGQGDVVTTVPLVVAVFATVVAGGAALAIAALAGRTRHPRVVFLSIAGIGLILTSVPPLTGATDTATAAWLLAMHAIVAVCLIPITWRALPAQRDDTIRSATTTRTT